jgi:hypothetical protein
VAQVVKHLSGKHKALSSNPVLPKQKDKTNKKERIRKLGVAGRSEVCCQPWLHSKFQVSLSYKVRPYLKKQNSNNKTNKPGDFT